LEEINQVLAGDRRAAARRLAFEITRIVHGEAAGRQAEADSLRAFGALAGDLPQDVPTVSLTQAQAEAGAPLVDLLVRAGVRSKSEARRLIEGGGVQVNGVRVEHFQQTLGLGDLKDAGSGRAALVRFGRGKIFKVQLLTTT
jgi:tyrosyl-tRNA synthetase